MTKTADSAEIKGTYTLILYGCRYASDVENVAILVDEKSGINFEVYALEGMYKVKKGIPGEQALGEAKKFINCGMHTVWQTALRKISEETGKAIAYELKPLYMPTELGIPEVLRSSYMLKDGKVTAYFDLDPTVKRNMEGGSGRSRGRGER